MQTTGSVATAGKLGLKRSLQGRTWTDVDGRGRVHGRTAATLLLSGRQRRLQLLHQQHQPPLGTGNVRRMPDCLGAEPRKSPMSPRAQSRADDRFAGRATLFPLSEGPLRGSAEKTLLLIRRWQSDCDGCHLTLPLKKRIEGVQTRSRCADSPSASCSSARPLLLLHSHFSITYLHFQPPVSTPILSNSPAAFIFARVQRLCWK